MVTHRRRRRTREVTDTWRSRLRPACQRVARRSKSVGSSTTSRTAEAATRTFAIGARVRRGGRGRVCAIVDRSDYNVLLPFTFDRRRSRAAARSPDRDSSEPSLIENLLLWQGQLMVPDTLRHLAPLVGALGAERLEGPLLGLGDHQAVVREDHTPADRDVRGRESARCRRPGPSRRCCCRCPGRRHQQRGATPRTAVPPRTVRRLSRRRGRGRGSLSAGARGSSVGGAVRVASRA